ncbi:MAG: hypothetical protein LRZ97_00650, partial [Candidatus Pacebacteria bacterium]|nr:hypothetical protein [Candidatus Paceibacterota bacterium]
MNLTDSIDTHFRLVTSQTSALTKLGLKSIKDLLMHIPNRYEDIGAAASVAQLQEGVHIDEFVTVYAEIKGLEKKLAWKTKRYSVEGMLQDDTGQMKIRW